MPIDHELRSLLIGIDNTKDSEFIIDLNHELLPGESTSVFVTVGEKDFYTGKDSTFAEYVDKYPPGTKTWKVKIVSGTQDTDTSNNKTILEYSLSETFSDLDGDGDMVEAGLKQILGLFFGQE